tara:strand:- start:213 stop:1493 length:1281 start_codon:yes stop_codon:yes gene_type:complete
MKFNEFNNGDTKTMKTMTSKEKKQAFLDACMDKFDADSNGDHILTIDQLKDVASTFGMKYAPQWIVKNPVNKVGKGLFKLPALGEVVSVHASRLVQAAEQYEPAPKTQKIENTETKTEAAYVVSSLTGNIVPEKDPNFVTFGDYSSVKSIIASKKFYPIFITGLSGNGKTLGVTQACAEKKREMIRVNITIETDEDDLLGGYRLRDGQTVWQNGPVIEAMERGAVLLLDEIDLASNKIMCLQPILEGNGVFVKKINKFVKPALGFTVVATANTKGKGSEDGQFIGTNVLNEAFLERFPITFEQKYPSVKIETKIISKMLETENAKDDEYATNLVNWADIIRKTYSEGGVDEIISTRRLVHIAKAYSIFRNKLKAVEVCTNRFDDDTKQSFIDLYTKIDSGVNPEELMSKESDEPIADEVEADEDII